MWAEVMKENWGSSFHFLLLTLHGLSQVEVEMEKEATEGRSIYKLHMGHGHETGPFPSLPFPSLPFLDGRWEINDNTSVNELG